MDNPFLMIYNIQKIWTSEGLTFGCAETVEAALGGSAS